MPQTIPLPRGFRTAGHHCGIKADPQQLDLALFVSETPCTAAGVFTTNRVCGAPVKVSRERVSRETARAVIISSGNANACTGERGLQDARWMTAEVAGLLDCPTEDVLVCSTGVIGQFLPREKIANGIPALVEGLGDSPAAFLNAARGMMTTDTVPKQAVRTAELNGAPIIVSGAAKGAAMIGPNMATMLSVILTDAHLSPPDADAMLRFAVDRSFNCISVEGHTSTSDSVILLANGAAHSDGEQSADTHSYIDAQRATLQRMICEVAEELARAIVSDAEGADHLMIIDVAGLRNREEAHCIAKSVAESPLVKTAIAGADPNWGRIVSACGYAGVELDERDITLSINETLIYQNAAAAEYEERSVSASMQANRNVHIRLEFPYGEAAVRFWASDLTKEYVRLNSEFTT